MPASEWFFIKIATIVILKSYSSSLSVSFFRLLQKITKVKQARSVATPKTFVQNVFYRFSFTDYSSQQLNTFSLSPHHRKKFLLLVLICKNSTESTATMLQFFLFLLFSFLYVSKLDDVKWSCRHMSTWIWVELGTWIL